MYLPHHFPSCSVIFHASDLSFSVYSQKSISSFAPPIQQVSSLFTY
ncbi:hypothetical protein HMPREF1548_02470 [Clostridium sp. KLE 1755]|nr:hypothetical protein HMPREF1548_02470 [Clostridium sp. KLE 1755]